MQPISADSEAESAPASGEDGEDEFENVAASAADEGFCRDDVPDGSAKFECHARR